MRRRARRRERRVTSPTRGASPGWEVGSKRGEAFARARSRVQRWTRCGVASYGDDTALTIARGEITRVGPISRTHERRGIVDIDDAARRSAAVDFFVDDLLPIFGQVFGEFVVQRLFFGREYGFVHDAVIEPTAVQAIGAEQVLEFGDGFLSGEPDGGFRRRALVLGLGLELAR